MLNPYRMSVDDGDNERKLFNYAIDYPGLPVYPQSLIIYQLVQVDSL